MPRATATKHRNQRKIDTFLMRIDARGRGFDGAGERANIADSTRREAKGKKKGKDVSRSRNSPDSMREDGASRRKAS